MNFSQYLPLRAKSLFIFLEKPSFSNSHSLILPKSPTISFHSLCPTTVISEAGIFLTCVGADLNETCVCVAVA